MCQPVASTAKAHIGHDATILETACLAFGERSVVYLANPSAIQAMRERLTRWPPNLKTEAIGMDSSGARRLRLRARLLYNHAAAMAAAARLNAVALIYLCFSTVECSISMLSSRPVPEYLLVHRNFHEARQNRILRSLLKWVGQRAYGLVFSEAFIAECAVSEHVLDPSRALVLPFPLTSLPDTKDAGTGIVMPGILRAEKDLGVVLEAASILNRNNPQILARTPIRVVGPYVDGADPRLHSSIIHYSSRPLSETEFNECIRSGRFVIVPFARKRYSHTALPGTFYRALEATRPIISSSLNSVEFLMTPPTHVGFTFKGPVDLARLIEELDSLSHSKYSQIQANIREFVSTRSMSEAARRLRAILPVA